MRSLRSGISIHTRREAVTPRSIFGAALVAWLDPNAGITKDAVTNRVSAWAGRVGSWAPSQAVGGAQPLWTPGGINGRPALYFDGTRWLFGSTALVQLSQGEEAGWFGIVKPDVAGTTDTLLAVPPGGTTTTWLKLNSPTTYVGQVYRTTSTTNFYTVATSTDPILFGMTLESGNIHVHKNAAKSVGAAVGNATPALVGSNMTLGQRRVDAVDVENLAGHMGDVILLNRAPTAVEKDALWRWARARWGL